MAERDLDQYLEGLGIDVNEEEKPKDDSHLREPGEDSGGTEEAGGTTDAAPSADPYDAENFDMEAALAPGGVYGLIPDDLSSLERTESFLVNLLLNLDPTYAVEVEEVDDEVHAEIYGGESGRIIGKGGRTLAALEFLTNAVVNRTETEGVRVVIDVGGYKRRRDERLRQTAQKAAERARNSGESVELEPMSAAERRVVHMAIVDETDVVSESTGEGRARRVVVKPAE